MKNLGLVYALVAFFIFGIAPLFWGMIGHIDSIEIIAHRTIWSALLSVVLIVLMREFEQFTRIFGDIKLLGRLAAAALLVTLNWGVYIWAITHDYIVESSMGYFINPLVNVLLGVLFFQESLRSVQKLAIFVAACGVAYLVVVHGQLPYIALVLAFSFGSYGAIKKSLNLPATHSIAVETLLMTAPALIYLYYLSTQNQLAFGQDLSSDVVLILGGVFTMTPLILFSAAAKKISLTALGMAQYLGPTVQLIIGVWVFNEAFDVHDQISFGLVWLALIIYTVDQLNHQRKQPAQL